MNEIMELRPIATLLLQLAMLLVFNSIFLTLYSSSPVGSSPFMVVLVILIGCISFVVTLILAGILLWMLVPADRLTDFLGEKRAELVNAFISSLIHMRTRITMFFVAVMVFVIIVFSVQSLLTL